jgi:hypothetical protein
MATVSVWVKITRKVHVPLLLPVPAGLVQDLRVLSALAHQLAQPTASSWGCLGFCTPLASQAFEPEKEERKN